MKTTTNTKSSIKFWILFFSLIISADIIIVSARINKIQSQVGIPRVQIMYDLNDPYTEPKVREYLIQLHVKYPDVAVAQMKLESANGTSKVFREGNNLFGMKVAVSRPTTALGERNNHAYYSHWRMSCIDYAMWQAFVEDPENIYSESAWINYISRMYSQDDNYKLKLLKIKNYETVHKNLQGATLP